MASISFGQQMNLSFMSSLTGAGGQKSTISNIAASISREQNTAIEREVALKRAQESFLGDMMEKKIATPSQSPLSALAYTNGGGRMVEIGRRPSSPWEFQSQRIYGQDEKTNVSAGFVVDSTVDGGNGDDEQTQTNLRQAAQIKNQMNIGKNDGSLESLARDLAVFGLDMTALNDTPEGLVEKIRERSLAMLDNLANSNGSVAERNRITGASARLVNGVESSAGAFFVVDSSTMVDVGGTEVNGDAAYSVGSVVVDPLVLDLEGDGIDLSSARDGVQFDMDGDGVKTQMGFIQGDDALLFVDAHGDGTVHDGTQLFGNNGGSANGFDSLAAHDDNKDGVIDDRDAIWNELRVWADRTQDGVSTRDETMTLAEAGVKAINLAYQNVRQDDGKGNLIGQTGSFTRDDGSTGSAADAWLHELGQA